MKIVSTRGPKGADVQAIHSGDVIEFRGADGNQSALVLLASEDGLIIDLCDDSTPISVRLDELEDVRVFDPYALQIAA